MYEIDNKNKEIIFFTFYNNNKIIGLKMEIKILKTIDLKNSFLVFYLYSLFVNEIKNKIKKNISSDLIFNKFIDDLKKSKNIVFLKGL